MCHRWALRRYATFDAWQDFRRGRGGRRDGRLSRGGGLDSGRVQQSVPVQPAQPYNQLGGSSFGHTGGYPYAGTYPGYSGGTTYGAPGAPYGWPGSAGYGGVPWPRY